MKNNILIYDIETAPMEVYTHYIGNKVSVPHGAIIKEPYIICIAYKWMGVKKVHHLQYDPRDKGSEKNMLEEFFQVVQKADAVYGQNSNSFDNRWLRAQAMKLEVETPWPNLEEIDLLVQARRTFRLPSYRLDYMAKTLGHGSKTKMDADDWYDICRLDSVLRVNAPDKILEKVSRGLFNISYKEIKRKGEKSLSKMVRYNCKDVALTEKVIKRMFRYFKLSLKEFRLFNNKLHSLHGDFICPYCTKQTLRKNGTRTLKTGIYQRYLCNSCGRSS